VLKIANEYGNFDLVHNSLPGNYQFVAGQRLQLIAKRLKIKFCPAITEFKPSQYKKYPCKPVVGGIVVAKSQAQKILAGIAARETPAAKLKAEKAAARREKKKDEFVETTGVESYLTPLARAIRAGRVDSDLGELIAFKARYRHCFTDYDSQYDGYDWDELKIDYGYDGAREFLREQAHDNKVEEPIPATWQEYLSKYRFAGPIAEALSKTLSNPVDCHPTWFKEAEIAIRRQPINLDQLTYFAIRDAIQQWREDRE